MTRRSRRAFGAGFAASLLLWAIPALAGSYLNRATLMLKQALDEMGYLRIHINDKELAAMIHRLAKARIEAAGAMSVPKEVVQAHPHLLLVLEDCERAAEAAELGQAERFLIYHQRALDEERTFRAVLKALGYGLPDAGK